MSCVANTKAEILNAGQWGTFTCQNAKWNRALGINMVRHKQILRACLSGSVEKLEDCWIHVWAQKHFLQSQDGKSVLQIPNILDKCQITQCQMKDPHYSPYHRVSICLRRGSWSDHVSINFIIYYHYFLGLPHKQQSTIQFSVCKGDCDSTIPTATKPNNLHTLKCTLLNCNYLP